MLDVLLLVAVEVFGIEEAFVADVATMRSLETAEVRLAMATAGNGKHKYARLSEWAGASLGADDQEQLRKCPSLETLILSDRKQSTWTATMGTESAHL